MKNLLTKNCYLLFAGFLILASSSFISRNYFEKQVRQNNFSYFFPDTALAIAVANRLHKTITEHVTREELAGITGDFVAGPGNIANLAGIGYLTGLDSFGCYKNLVTTIPAEIGKLKNLVYLDLCKAFDLKTIPPEIGRLKKLQMIRLCLTSVKSIPKEIGSLKEIRTLWLSANHLTEIPKEIGSLPKLQDLDIRSNKIKSIPTEIGNLKSLTSLNISHCGLTELPENIGNLKELKTLNLFNNKLRFLPKSIIHLENLTSLNIFDNFNLSENYKKYLPVLLKNKK